MSRELNIKPGDRFYRLTIITECETRKTLKGYYKRYFVCRCDCGTTKKVRLNELRNGKIKSCGCLQKEFHTLLKTTLKKDWNKRLVKIQRTV